MSVLADFIQDCRAEHDRLCRLLGRWAGSADLTEHPRLPLTPPPARPFVLADGVLGLRRALPGSGQPFRPRPPLDLADERAQPPPSEPASDADGNGATSEPAGEGDPARHPVEQARLRLLRQLSLLGFEIAGIHGGLLELLADIVLDSQISRTLLFPDDRYHVSSASVLGAMALANLAYACAGNRAAPGVIELPLQVAASWSGRFRNGDLLFWDVMARSVHAAMRDRATRPDAQQVLRRFLPTFLTYSTLGKLDLCFDLPVAICRLVSFQHWPGLEGLVADPGAASIRRYLVGRLALRAAQNPAVGGVVLCRWLDRLNALDDGLQLPAGVLAAQTLWELLAHKEDAVKSMIVKGRLSDRLRDAVARIETLRNAPEPRDPLNLARHRCLRDAACCLDTYGAYRALRGMNRMDQSMHRMAAAISEDAEP